MKITIFEKFFLTPETLREWFPDIEIEILPLRQQKVSYLQQAKSDLILLSEIFTLESKKNLPYFLAITSSYISSEMDWISSKAPLIEIQKKIELILKFLIEKKKNKIYEENLHNFFEWIVIGKIASGTMHEMNNPLQVMLVTIEEIEDRLYEQIEYREEISLLKEEIYRCCDIVKNLQYSKMFQGLEYQDSKLLLESTLQFLQYQINKKKVNIVKEIPENIPYIQGNPKIKIVFLAIVLEVLENSKDHEKIFFRIVSSNNHIIVTIDFTTSSENQVYLFPFFLERLLQETSVNLKHIVEQTFHKYILELPEKP